MFFLLVFCGLFVVLFRLCVLLFCLVLLFLLFLFVLLRIRVWLGILVVVLVLLVVVVVLFWVWVFLLLLFLVLVLFLVFQVRLLFLVVGVVLILLFFSFLVFLVMPIVPPVSVPIYINKSFYDYYRIVKILLCGFFSLYLYKLLFAVYCYMDGKKLLVRVILEMLGAPMDYIEQTLKDYVVKLKTDGLVVKKESYAEAKPQDKLFSTFVELEIEFKDLDALLVFCFEALPSSVEILEPVVLSINAHELTGFLNDLQARLHEADMIIKTSRAHNKILDLNTSAVFQNFLLFALKQGSKSLDELSVCVGVSVKELEGFVNKLVEAKKIKPDGAKFVIV